MIRTSFNDGWEYRPKVSRHAEMMGGAAEWTPVTLPHDAMIGTDRSPSASAASGYFPAGTWEYRRTLDVTAEESGDTFLLLFEGVYRDAVVTVNGAVAAHRPSGYSPFHVPIDHLLRFDAGNEIVVSVRAGDDSRWYSGAGIYRNVWLLRSGPLHLAPDRVEVRTPEVDDGGAVVTVAAVVRNRASSSRAVDVRVELLDDTGTVVSVDEATVTTFPGDELTVRRRLFVADPQRWGIDHPHLYTCRVSRARRRHDCSTSTPPRSASAPCRSTHSVDCASTASTSISVERASTTTTARSVRRRSIAPTSVGSSCSRRRASTRSAAPTIR